MNAILTCSACQKKTQVPQTALGKMVRCPHCQQVFLAQVDAPAAATPTIPPPPVPSVRSTPMPVPPPTPAATSRPPAASMGAATPAAPPRPAPPAPPPSAAAAPRPSRSPAEEADSWFADEPGARGMAQNQPPLIPGFSRPHTMFGTPRAGVKDCVLWGSGMLAVALGVGIAAVIFLGKPQEGAEKAVPIVLLILAVLAALISAFFWLNLVWIKGRRIWLFPEGVVDTYRQKVSKVFRWEEIEELVYWSNIADLAMRKEDGTQFDFNPETIDHATGLADAILENGIAAMAPRVLERLRRGATLEFGRVQVDARGITVQLRDYRATKPRSFYSGPWPRGDLRTLAARNSERESVRLAWEDLHDVGEDEENNVMLVTSSGALNTFACPGDVPNHVLLPALASVLGGR